MSVSGMLAIPLTLIPLTRRSWQTSGCSGLSVRPFHLRDLGSRQELMVSWVPSENASGFAIYEVEPARRVSIVNRKWG
jgi:hypothetical protein